jgi:hypothetical protein
MTSIRRLILTLSIAALFATPAMANASVGDKLSRASKALDDAAGAANGGDRAGFDAASRANRRLTVKAAREARGVGDRSRRARLMRRVAAASDSAVDEYAALIALVPPSLQLPVVDGLADAAQIRDRLTDMLLQMAEGLAEPARSQVVDAIARFQSDGEIGALFEALSSGEVLDGVKALIQEQIEALGAHLDGVLSQLEELTGILPPHAGEALDGAIAMIQSHLAHVTDLIGGLLDGFGGLPLGGGFDNGGFCELLGGLPFPIPLPICD